MNQRLQNSLSNDPNLRITVNLVDVLILNVLKNFSNNLKLLIEIFKNPSLTPWTNSSLVSVPGYYTYNGVNTVLDKTSFSILVSAMKTMNLPYTYDYAAAFMK